MLRVRSECPLRLGPHPQCPVFFTHHLPLRFMKGWEGASPASPQPQGTGPWLSPDMSDQPGRKDFLLQEGQAPLQEPRLLPRLSLCSPLLPRCPAGGVTGSGVIVSDFWVGLAKVTPIPTPGPSLGFPEPCPTPSLPPTPFTITNRCWPHQPLFTSSATINLHPAVSCVYFPYLAGMVGSEAHRRVDEAGFPRADHPGGTCERVMEDSWSAGREEGGSRVLGPDAHRSEGSLVWPGVEVGEEELG